MSAKDLCALDGSIHLQPLCPSLANIQFDARPALGRMPKERLPGFPRMPQNRKLVSGLGVQASGTQEQKKKSSTANVDDEVSQTCFDSPQLAANNKERVQQKLRSQIESGKRVSGYQDWMKILKATTTTDVSAKSGDVDREESVEPSRHGSFAIDAEIESIGGIIMREKEDLSSKRIGRLEAKTHARIVATGTDSRRICIRIEDGTQGWVSTSKENGEPLCVCLTEITKGTVLFAVENEVRVFYDTELPDVICLVAYGERVVATGPPVFDGQFTMVPVELLNGAHGAIQKGLLQTTEPLPRPALPGHAPCRAKLDPGPLSLDLVYVVPPPDDVIGSIVPRLVAYGDSFTAEICGQKSYARALVETLNCNGMAVELFGCGLPGLSARRLALDRESTVIMDSCKRPGAGLETLVKPQSRGGKAADLVLVMAGTCDLFSVKGYAASSPEEIFDALRELHQTCFQHGAVTVALGLPDIGSVFARPEILKKRHAINSALSRWVRCEEVNRKFRPALFLHTGALLPYGPRARSEGLWVDGLHLTSKGMSVLGRRIAFRVAHLVAQLREQRVLTLEAEGVENTIPFEAFLQAFTMGCPLTEIELGDWELSALLILQTGVRAWIVRRRAKTHQEYDRSRYFIKSSQYSYASLLLSKVWEVLRSRCSCLR